MKRSELEAIIKEEIQFALEDLRKWFRKDKDGAGPGKGGGWVDCNTCRKTKGGRKKCKPCAAKKGKKENIPVVGQLQENVVSEATGERNLKNKKT